MRVLYFAWVRTHLERPSDTVQTPCATVQDVVSHLKSRGGKYCEIFSDFKGLRVAVNQEFADLTTTVKPSDEIAFFPPVTGG